MYTAQASLIVSANQQTTWDFVSNYQNFDQFMPNIKSIVMLEGNLSEWHLSGPLGIPVSWQATTITDAPKRLAWQSVEGVIDTNGYIELETVEATHTKITVFIEYQPPLGAIGEAFALLFKDPQNMLEEGLAKLGGLLSANPVVILDKAETRAASETL
jgi:uncharacterized membrane protein